MQRFSDKFGKIWRNGIADHLVLISLGTTELEVVGKPLKSRRFTNRNRPRLLWIRMNMPKPVLEKMGRNQIARFIGLKNVILMNVGLSPGQTGI